MIGFGWCHLRSSREAYRSATIAQVDEIDKQTDLADEQLWRDYRDWMADHACPFLQWQFHETLNFENGLLTYCVARNHRTSIVWDMLAWIAANGPGSYGLFYVHDDEDAMGRQRDGRGVSMDFNNVFRVHRIMNGAVLELDDPFFGVIDGNIGPIHPYDRATEE